MKALALVDAPDHVCCRYRVRAFEPALAAAGWSLTVQGLESNPIRRWLQLRQAGRFDAVLLQRRLLPAWQLHELRLRARRLIFDFDDAILFRDSYHPRGPRSRRRAERFANTVRLADAVLAGNSFLIDCALSVGARPDRVVLLPTCIDPTLYTPAPHRAERAGLDLVWIGSSSTLQGLELRRTLWQRLAHEVPNLRLRVIADRAPRFAPLRVIAVPWSEATEAAGLATSDVGISYLPDDLWSRGKCGLKILQYQAAGLPVIANPIGVHPEMIAPGATGFLPDSDDAWVSSILTLASDPTLRAQFGATARASVTARYSVASWSQVFLSALTGPAPIPSPRLTAPQPAAVSGPFVRHKSKNTRSFF